MKIAFRTDASLVIGTGHVMRCLTLARALRARGAECRFICRSHDGHLLDRIRESGFEAVELPPDAGAAPLDADDEPQLAHAPWLGASWQRDSEATIGALAGWKPEWLVVDHYAIDKRWQSALRPHCGRIMVIDDLADRDHECDLLLDQTFGRNEADYLSLVPARCRMLCGSEYALLRPEFAAMRTYSLQRRLSPSICKLLISMGGVDQPNATGRVLTALRNTSLPRHCQITVVMGLASPWIRMVQAEARTMPWSTNIVIDANNMAQLMADSDLIIGAAGATSWERCCLGVPSIALTLADNQRVINANLARYGAVIAIDEATELLLQRLSLAMMQLQDPSLLRDMAMRAARVTHGFGPATIGDILSAS